MPKKIVIVGAFPPSKQGLNEYNYHLAESLALLGNKVTVIASALTPFEERNPEKNVSGAITVIRAWKFDSASSAFHIVRQVIAE